jgi:hypothetical protein
MTHVISKEQAGYVEGRQIMDNFILVHEVIHFLFPLVPEYFTISLWLVYTMPCERGKPKRGPTYYIFVA